METQIQNSVHLILSLGTVQSEFIPRSWSFSTYRTLTNRHAAPPIKWNLAIPAVRLLANKHLPAPPVYAEGDQTVVDDYLDLFSAEGSALAASALLTAIADGPPKVREVMMATAANRKKGTPGLPFPAHVAAARLLSGSALPSDA